MGLSDQVGIVCSVQLVAGLSDHLLVADLSVQFEQAVLGAALDLPSQVLLGLFLLLFT